MGIAYNLPFIFKLNGIICSNFTSDRKQIFNDEFASINVHENEEINFVFDSQDQNARLYLEALDIIVNEEGVSFDEFGRAYRKASPNEIVLYSINGDYDALRVDSFEIKVICNGESFYSILNVLPKQIDLFEWKMMREDLEKEANGLAQDLVRRNIGLGYDNIGIIPPKQLYNFFVIKKYASRLLSALIELKDSPKYRIDTDHKLQDGQRAVKLDSYSNKMFLKKGGIESNYFVPYKTENYDIQENRLLKHIINVYDNELSHFILKLEAIKEYRKRKYNANIDLSKYEIAYEKGIDDFIEKAKQLQKITNIIKTQDWYRNVGGLTDGTISHTFVLDSRYGVVYRMYQDLQHTNFNVQMDSNYAYSWKKTSEIYEMWCFVKLCRCLAQQYNVRNELFDNTENTLHIFPYLDEGKRMVFYNDDVRINVIYNQFVPRNEKESTLNEHPFYCVGRHNHPDITIDVYNIKTEKYIGSLILECKYRKFKSFWKSEDDSKSSRPQIECYYVYNKSRFIYGLGEILDIRPISNVIVLTPDYQGDNRQFLGINTSIKALRTDEEDTMINEVIDVINDNIEKMLEKEELTRNKIANIKYN